MTKTLILLAAGLSRRYGAENKLLAGVDGLPMYRHILDKLERLRDGETALLVMTNTPEIQADCTARQIEWRESPRAAEGIAQTIRCALEHAPETDAYVFFVADQPKLKETTIRSFLHRCGTSDQGLGCLCSGKGRGNPAWFRRRYLPELCALSGDRGGRTILERHPEDLLLCGAGAEELEDVDVPSCHCVKFPVQ